MMKTKSVRYAVVDIETTGGRAQRDKITEIAIVLYDGEKIVEQFETLINPECPIPYGITELTGISQEMVKDAPKFFEVAKQIVQLTEGAVFVAHNVQFDYGFLQEEFRRLGYPFTRRRLCTVKLSRRSFPGLTSYSLGNLIRHFGIPVNARHRAMADALATTSLLERILGKDGAEGATELIHRGIKEANLPATISLDQLHELPESCGVYYFHNQAGQVIYVGKSINIQKRIMEHFADYTNKGNTLRSQVYDLSYELTGSELIALLLESFEIKRLRPSVNRAQRRQYFPYGIHTFTDAQGYLRMEVVKLTATNRKNLQLITECPSPAHGRSRLEAAFHNFELCQRLAGLSFGTGACFYYHLQQCKGACVGQESSEDYNDRAAAAIDRLRTTFEEDFFLVEPGREAGERAVVLVENGQYRGFGFIGPDDEGEEAWRRAIKRVEPNPECNRIVQGFMAGNKVVKVKVN